MPSQLLFDRCYTQRAIVIKLLVCLAARLGYDHGWGIDDDDLCCPEWRNVMYVQLPEGQYSWHIAPADKELFSNIKQFGGKWDKTFHGQNKELASLMKIDYDIPLTPAHSLIPGWEKEYADVKPEYKNDLEN